MDYPKDFSTEAQAAVEAEKIKAVKDFEKAKREIQNRYDTAVEVRSLLAHCIMRVFRVFAHEACEIGRSGVWTVSRIDKEAHGFLAEIAKELWYDYGYDITGVSLGRITNDINGSLLSNVERNFKRSAEWADYEDERLEVAKAQAKPTPPHAAPDAKAHHITSAGAVESGVDEVTRRSRLLADYKEATGNPSNRKIYTAKNSGIHKPEFFDWVNGELLNTSQTCINFERFLREKKPPIPRKPRA
jgi:hypothetical protein